MGRLDSDILTRAEHLCDRCLDVAESLDRARVSHRIYHQLIGSASSVGANVYEADEAMSRSDFAKTLGIAVKELNETRFWIRLIGRRAWVAPARLEELEAELLSFKRVLGTMIARTRGISKPSPGGDPSSAHLSSEV